MNDQTLVKILTKNHYEPAALVGILQEIQAEYQYLPRPALEQVARQLKLPLSQIYSIATFYKAFSLVPRGKHLLQLCQGTACHVRGAPLLLAKLERELKIKAGGTTDDRLFSLESVRCVGCCSLAPVVRIGADTFGKMTQKSLSKIIARYQGMEEEEADEAKE